MKSLYSQLRIFNFSQIGWMLAAIALTFSFVVTTAATEPAYTNNAVVNYSIPDGTPPPTIDATNFINLNQFNFTFQDDSQNAEFYEPMNTVNYTNHSSGNNTSLMTVNSPLLTNNLFGGFGFTYNSGGVGFRFDTQTTNTIPHRMAGTFYNAGTIRSDSVLDGNNTVGGAFSQGNVGQCIVWATNIICPGTIDTSENGFIELTGSNVDLTRAVIAEEQQFGQGASPTNINISATPELGNIPTWNPGYSLTPTTATSAPPVSLTLTNSTAYLVEFPVITSTSTNIIYEALFLMSANTNVVPTSVYMAPSDFGGEGALIQWAGTYLDPASGQSDTTYLYLFHHYIDSTNILNVLSVGVPPPPPGPFGGEFFDSYNYLWGQTLPYPNLGTTSPSGFTGNFPYQNITNFYEGFNGGLEGTTANTNQSASNPSGALTNIMARIQIMAADLRLTNAIISGQNYLSLTATNQFYGSAGALISSPFSDINLAVHRGTLTISNLLIANIPQWGGTLNEWSTRWTNSFNGVNQDFRVSLVYADLTPTLAPQIQNLTLLGTNLVVSDALNVFGSTFASAQSLTLTANAYGSGATSPDGELNLQEQNPLTWSWNGSFPNVLWLTNSGAIRLPNYSDFIGQASIPNITAAVPAIQASAMLSEVAPSNNVAAGGTILVGGTTYAFVNKLTNTIPFQVKVGTSLYGSMSNLIDAINGGPGSGAAFSTNTAANSLAGASLLTIPTNGLASLIISANADNFGGVTGNEMSVSTTITNFAFSSTVLSGGVNGTPAVTNIDPATVPYGAIVNNGFISDQGATMWVTNFINGGVISNGIGNFELVDQTAEMTNGIITANGDISFSGNTLIASNIVVQAGGGLLLQLTNELWDGDISNGNVWTAEATNGTGGIGLDLPFLPTNTAPLVNNLLGSTISLVAPQPNKQLDVIWAGLDYGATTNGYNTNNMAIGQLTLTSMAINSPFYFSGPSDSTTSNAIYVDRLILNNYASLAAREGSAGIPTLLFNPNFTIYYGDAQSSETVNGGPLVDVSSILNGLNGNHLQWVPSQVGMFSGMDVRYSNGSVNRLNAGLATGGGNSQLDSTGSGVPNGESSDPVFVSSQINFHVFHVGDSNKLVWNSTPGATNYVYFCTTNFASWNVAAVITNSAVVPPPGGWPITNILYEPITVSTGANSATNNCYYRVKVIQDNAIYQGE